MTGIPLVNMRFRFTLKPLAAFFCTLCFFAAVLTAAETDTAQKQSGTLAEGDVQSVTDSLLKTLKSNAPVEKKLEASQTLAALQERLGLYADAEKTYTAAASFAGERTLNGQKMLLGSVRCALCRADVSTADFLLSTSVAPALNAADSASSASEASYVKASAKLYALWSWIIKAQNKKELEAPLKALRSYADDQDMISVKPALLLTLYHITGEKRWAEKLKNDFPFSPEASVANGQAEFFPAPFWYFLTLQSAAD